MTGQTAAVVFGGSLFAVALLAGVFCAGVEVGHRHARPLRRGGVTFADPDWQPQSVPELVAEPATPPPTHEGCFLPGRTDPERADSILRHRAQVLSAHGGCRITGSALLTERDGQLQWDQADPAIHITQELLDELDERGQGFLAATYEVGDRCRLRPESWHAFRIRAA